MMAGSYSNLVVVSCTTAGQAAGELLGSDESEIVHILWSVVDTTANTVSVPVQSLVVKPDHSELSDEAKSRTGLDEGAVADGAPIQAVLEQLHQSLTNGVGAPFCLVVDGQQAMRQCLHPETCKKGISLPDYFYAFFDLRREFRKFQSTSPAPIGSVGDMAQHLGLDVTAVDECQAMCLVIQRLIGSGHKFTDPETVDYKYEPGTYQKSELIDDDTILRVRGLPWQSSDQDIARFFRGLNITKGGVAVCLNPQGRRNGEALVRFASKEHRDLALLRHKHHIGQRYIEVYKATGEDFLKVAGGNANEATAFLRDSAAEVIVRMRGLPYTATAADILNFFGQSCPVAGVEKGILFVRYANGRSTGDAFVLFETEAHAQLALAKHKESLGKRYIELFRSTAAEVQQVWNRYQQFPLIPTTPTMIPMLPQQAITCGSIRDCVRMRGLPYQATHDDVLAFLGEFAVYVRDHGIHMVLNSSGKPSGDCFIQMYSPEAARQAAEKCHRQYMGDRYIEVFQCSGDEMNFVLMGGQLNKNGIVSPPNVYAAEAPVLLDAQMCDYLGQQMTGPFLII
ncbi:ESRP1 [Branchiostoma lanceolatum]|uniref:ESRP1 protein n=1 Tax=Branchiostoma lanceolatum TaxID=7740 RepID=A0A8K0A7G9_BRALA|nr:ESRP1 [Branchiostoma lanceolatum]